MPTLTDITSSFIKDAEGHWHDLSKGAFDAFTITHPGAPATIDPDFFNQPLQQIAQKIKETGYEKLGQYKEALAAFSGAAISSAVTKYAGAEAMGTMVGGIPGAALGMALEMGVEWLFDFKDDKQDSYRQGQWWLCGSG